jgi:signal transduction histidine kinase
MRPQQQPIRRAGCHCDDSELSRIAIAAHVDGTISRQAQAAADAGFDVLGGGAVVAIPRETQGSRPPLARSRRKGIIVQHPAAEAARDSAGTHPEQAAAIGVLESRLRDEARLEGARLAAREMAHLLNNDLAVAVGLVDLLQHYYDLPPQLRMLLDDAAGSLHAAARHIEQLQGIVRVVVKDTPAGASLDLERSRT